MRVALGELFQETCAFSPVTTTGREFDVTPPADLVASFSETGSELGGMLSVLDETEATVLPLHSARMVPGAGGPVAEATFETFAGALVDRLGELSPDAVLLAVHGAMMTTERTDPEGELLARINGAVDDVPVVATLDHHAHLTESMVDHLDGLVAYTTHPHTDVRETGERAARLCLSVARGAVDPCLSMVKAPMTSATRTETDRKPMAAIFDLRRNLEVHHDDALAVSFLPAHCWLDVPDLGFTGVAVTDGNPSLADDIACQLAARAWEHRHEFAEQFPSVAETVDAARTAADAPVVISDRGDITLGGAPGDSPAFLRELLERPNETDLSAVIPVVDPPAVERLVDRSGEQVTEQVGGAITPSFEPVTVEAIVDSVHQGPITQQGTYYAGTTQEVGPRVVLRLRERPIHLVVSARPQLTTHPSFFSGHGIDPTEMDLVVVKSAGHFRPNFEPLAGEIRSADSPGACPVDLDRCPYDRARPLYPVDVVQFDPTPYRSG